MSLVHRACLQCRATPTYARSLSTTPICLEYSSGGGQRGSQRSFGRPDRGGSGRRDDGPGGDGGRPGFRRDGQSGGFGMRGGGGDRPRRTEFGSGIDGRGPKRMPVRGFEPEPRSDGPRRRGFGLDSVGPRDRDARGSGFPPRRCEDGPPTPLRDNSPRTEADATTTDEPAQDTNTPWLGRDRGRRGEERSSRSFRHQTSDEIVISRDRGRGGEKSKRTQDVILSAARVPKVKRDDVKKVKIKEERKVFIPSSVSVGRLADIFGVKIFNLQMAMKRLGLEEDQRRSDYLLTSEQACDVAIEYGLDPVVDDDAAFDLFPEPESDPSGLPLRPPVVTIMGHVDHGKTTLLDNLRRSSVAAGEAGGITQHIGAFSVPLSTIMPEGHTTSADSPGTITFLDTPGHAAFTGMRARGAHATDLVVLVVAADDGVMPQTKEVIELVKAEGDKVGLVVAINKCDKPGVDTDRVKSALGTEGVLLEEDNGDTPAVRVSGLTGLGLDQLVETLATLAEVRDLRARQDGSAEGVVLESKVDRGRGNVATVLVRKGTLTAGASIVAGTTWGRVRQMQDSAGRALKTAGPGTPVSLTGWKDLPAAGDVLLEAADEETAKRAITNRLRDIERKKMLADVESINEKRAAERRRAEREEALLARLKEEGKSEAEVAGALREFERRGGDMGEDGEEGAGKKELRLVIKADVSGTVEAVVGSLEGIGNKEAGVKIVHTGVGEVGESDVNLAEAADATIVAFSVPTPKSVLTLARNGGVPVHSDTVIYRLIETVTKDVAALLPPLRETRVVGEATVQQVFEIKLKGRETAQIAGCRVMNGVVEIKEGTGVRVMRASVGEKGKEGERVQVYEGTITTLKHLKKDVTEVRKGTECGIGLEGFRDVREGDEIVTFTSFDVPRTL